ncbi:MAG: SufD family Fe-S cluster assembly protein [Firmicutes bacterium]|nr:SufD family Fe-S cluster assembly protein [Bacillota bacterium]
MFDIIDKGLLKAVADLEEIPKLGAYNIRKNGQGVSRRSTENVQIIPKEDKPGIDIIVSPGAKAENVHIPVILSEDGMNDTVYNTFRIGDGADVTIVAGCGIHNSCDTDAGHNGIHEFFIGKNAHVKYVEKHYGEGKGKGKRILNPVTKVHCDENSTVEMEMVQISGVDDTVRDTDIDLAEGAKMIITERLLTDGEQYAKSIVNIAMEGTDSSARIMSRSVAKDDSKQEFLMNLIGRADCRGHIQCDSIIMGNAHVSSVPQISAEHSDAQLIHEAAIGKIAGAQLLKLMSLGLSEEEAEDTILQGFLK